MVTVINKNRIPFFINNPNLQIINLQCEQVTDMRVQGAINKIPRSIQYYTSTQFNVYTLEWTPEQIIFSVNGYVHYTYIPNPQNSETEMEVDYVRAYETSTLSNQAETVPDHLGLLQNYPNPFNPVTTLRYDLPENCHVNITIYDMLGRKVKTLINQTQNAGYRSIVWNATNDYGKPVSAGIYLYQIQAGEYISTKKMVLLK